MVNKVIEEIKELQIAVLKDMDELNQDNFSKVFSRILDRMQSLKEIREDIASRYDKSDFEIYEDDLLYLAKEIRKKYDNIIEIYRQKIAESEQRLSELLNLRKIYNYSR